MAPSWMRSRRVVESGTIAVVDLVFITKDSDGVGEAIEVDRKDDPRFAGSAVSSRAPSAC